MNTFNNYLSTAFSIFKWVIGLIAFVFIMGIVIEILRAVMVFIFILMILLVVFAFIMIAIHTIRKNNN